MSTVALRGAPSKGKPCPVEKIRNIGIVAHIDSGKTTISERMLKLSGRIRKLGEVHDGEAALDFLKEEKERGITIGSAATHFEWDGFNVHLIDTPGHVDFTAEVERSLRVLDGAILAIDSVAGAQAQSETVNRQLDKYDVPRIVFVNKVDRVGADYYKAVGSLRDRLGLNAVPLQVPVEQGPGFRAIIDLVRFVQYSFTETRDDPAAFVETPVDEAFEAQALEAREKMLDAISMFSDELMEVLLEGGEPPVEMIMAAVRSGVCSRGFVPCLCGAALRNIGVTQLLTAVADYLPSPLDKGAVQGRDPRSGDPLAFEPVEDAPLGALVFKTVHFPTGDLTFVRLFSGSFSTGDTLYNPRLGRTERVGRIFKVHAASREAVEKVSAGEIVACMGLKQSGTGDTLCLRRESILYSAATFARPVISMAVEPVCGVDRDKLGEVLGVIAREDPTFRVTVDGETGQTLISGMGELHLEVISHRIRDEFRVPVLTGRPRVAYRQTFSGSARVEARHIKQTGGSGQFAVAVIDFEPMEGDGVEFVDQITHGKITREFLAALEKGIRAYLLGGGKRGAQIQGVRATVVDGKMHEVDSSVTAFQACGVLAARMGEQRCKTVLLEPVMRLEVALAGDSLGTVLGDLNSRRAVIRDVEDGGREKTISAEVPLAELRAYPTALRSMTSGRGDATMELAGYRPVPPSLLADVEKEIA